MTDLALLRIEKKEAFLQLESQLISASNIEGKRLWNDACKFYTLMASDVRAQCP